MSNKMTVGLFFAFLVFAAVSIPFARDIMYAQVDEMSDRHLSELKDKGCVDSGFAGGDNPYLRRFTCPDGAISNVLVRPEVARNKTS